MLKNQPDRPASRAGLFSEHEPARTTTRLQPRRPIDVQGKPRLGWSGSDDVLCVRQVHGVRGCDHHQKQTASRADLTMSKLPPTFMGFPVKSAGDEIVDPKLEPMQTRYELTWCEKCLAVSRTTKLYTVGHTLIGKGVCVSCGLPLPK